MSKLNCKKKRNLVFDHRQLHSITKYLEVARKALAPLTINDCNWHSTNVFLVRRSSVKDELNERHSGFCRLRANLSFSFFRSLSLSLTVSPNYAHYMRIHAVFFPGGSLTPHVQWICMNRRKKCTTLAQNENESKNLAVRNVKIGATSFCLGPKYIEDANQRTNTKACFVHVHCHRRLLLSHLQTAIESVSHKRISLCIVE